VTLAAGPPELTRELVTRLVAAAGRAPSSHNTQPWRFAIEDGAIELRADRTRALPVNDPDDRELTISCGAALLNLRVAARASGLEPHVALLPDAADEDLLARVDLTPGPPPTRADELLAGAIDTRWTTRSPFESRPLPDGLAPALALAAAAEATRLVMVSAAASRAVLAGLVAEGDRRQFEDTAWRRELADWIRPRAAGDGLSPSRLGAAATRRFVAHLDIGRSVSERDRGLAVAAPVLAVLTTREDLPTDWLAAGQGLERALLTAAASGAQAGFLNQPCQLPDLRSRLGQMPAHGVPQVVLRIGFASAKAPPAPRRPVQAILGN
jgi:nitroreductase